MSTNKYEGAPLRDAILSQSINNPPRHPTHQNPDHRQYGFRIPGHTGSERSVYALPMPTAPAQPAAPGLAKAMGARDRRIAHGRGGRHRDAMARPRVPQCPTRLVFGVAARLVGGMGRARGVHTRMGARIGVRSPHSTHYFARARGPNTPSHLQCMSLSPPVQRSSQATRS